MMALGEAVQRCPKTGKTEAFYLPFSTLFVGFSAAKNKVYGVSSLIKIKTSLRLEKQPKRKAPPKKNRGGLK